MKETYFINFNGSEKAININEIAHLEQGDVRLSIIFTLKSGIEKTWRYDEARWMENDWHKLLDIVDPVDLEEE